MKSIGTRDRDRERKRERNQNIGRGESIQMALKFSREDEQILALNYENLCDNDYLHKLFVSDQNIVKDEHSFGEQSKTASESYLSNAEFPEDVIIFGDQMTLGKTLFDRRIRKDLLSYLRFQDGLALQISRQSIIYEHMADVMLRKFEDSTSATPKLDGVTTKQCSNNSDNDMFQLVLNGLFSIFGDDEILTSSNLRSIMDVLIKFYDPSTRNQNFGDRVNFDKIRNFVSKNIYILHSLRILNKKTWDKSMFREEVKSVLFSIYCYVCVGLLSREISDLVVALDCLIKLHIQVEYRTEDVITRAKDVLFNNSHSVKEPASVSTVVNSSKKQKKTGKDKVGKQVSNDLADSSDHIGDESKQELEVVETTLKSVGSGSKLNSLKEKGPLPNNFGETNSREVHKTKPPKKSQDSPKPILQNEAKESGNNFGLLVTNHAVIEHNEPIIGPSEKIFSKKTKPNLVISGSGSSSSPSKPVNSSDSSILVFTPRTTTRKMEREVKDCVHEAMRVPSGMIQLLSTFASSVGRSTVKSHTTRTSVATQENVLQKSSTKVWSSGQNSYGELGLGDVNTRKSFSRVTSLDDKGIVSIGAGNEHSLFVTKTGKLYTAGYNDNGQCGVGTTQQVRQPTIVQSLEDEEIMQVFVFNGCEHTIAVTKEGKVFSFGYNYRGQVRNNFVFLIIN